MSIEKDIQQLHFRNEYQKATVNLLFTHNWIMEKVKSFLESENITSQQYNILRILRGSKTPLNTLQIQQRMLDKMSDTSRIVDRLILKELVTKKTSTIDKRKAEISIGKKGLELLARLDEQNEQLDNILQNISTEEAKELNKLLDKIRQH